MKSWWIAIIFAVTLLVGCEEQKMPQKAETPVEKPEKVTVENIGMLSFKEVDINNDGKFTYDEFDKITENKGSAEGNTVYAEYDVDGNGIISKKEFSK